MRSAGVEHDEDKDATRTPDEPADAVEAIDDAQDDTDASTSEQTSNKDTFWGVEKPSLPQFRVRRRRVSAEELSARLYSLRSARRARQEERTPEDSARLMRRWIAAGLGTALVVTTITASLVTNGLDVTRSDNDRRISDLQAEAVSVEADALPDDVDVSERLQSLVDSAGSAAEKVATGQQVFAGLQRAATTSKVPKDGSPNKKMLAVVDHRKDLASLFDESSFVVDDEEAYQWSTAGTIDIVTEIDPRYSWYVRYNADIAAKPSTYEWSVKTLSPVLDSQHQIPQRAEVVWLCQDTKTDEVLAWARATYVLNKGSNDSGDFEDLEVAVTSIGAQQQRPQDRVDTKIPELDKKGKS